MLSTISTWETLAAIPAPGWDGFTLGPLEIRAYALCIILGAILAFWLGNRRWKKRDGAEGAVFDVGIWALLFGIVGARLYHVFTNPGPFFGPGFDGSGDPVRILYIWEGGIGIMGAISMGALGAWIACRRYGYKIAAFADVVAPGILLAQAIGRWGNYFNQELFGGPTDLPWGLEVDANHYNFPDGYPADTLFHPTFLYESLWNLLGVVVLLLIDRKFQLRRGMMLWSYVAWYGAGRTVIENLRTDYVADVEILGVTMRLHAWISLALFVVAAVMLVYLFFTRPRTAEKRAEAETVWLPGRAPDTTTQTATDTEHPDSPQPVGSSQVNTRAES